MFSKQSSDLQNYLSTPLSTSLFAKPPQKPELYENVSLGQLCFEFQTGMNSKSPCECLYQGPDILFITAMHVDLANISAFS